MDTLEHLVHKMECKMDRADNKLDDLSLRLDQFEAKILIPMTAEGNSSDQENRVAIMQETEGKHPNGDNCPSEIDDDDDGLDPKLVTELLVEVKRVKKEYDQLLQDVHQVQELQQEVTRSLRKQMKQVQSHFDSLRDRVIGSTGGSLPTNK